LGRPHGQEVDKRPNPPGARQVNGRRASGAASLAAGVMVGRPLMVAGVGTADHPSPPTDGAATTTTASDPPTVPRAEYERVRAKSWQRLLGWRRAARQRDRLRRRLRVRWQPTVHYAFTLAAAVYGVPRWQLQAVSWCESRFDPYAANGRYQGIFQLGWSPFGLSPYDPIASALSAAQTVSHDGGWRQWECKP